MAHFKKILVLFLYSWTQIHASQIQARLEHIQGSDPIATRFILKPRLDEGVENFKVFSDLFFETDLQEKIPYSEAKKSKFYLNEIYLNLGLGDFSFRAGRQALRWSEAWALPSMDIWTSRRLDRFFFDPPEDQFKHSTGFLVQFLKEKYELEAFVSGQTGKDTPLHPWPPPETDWQTEGGFRGKLRWGGFDFSALAARARAQNHFGVAVNYATENMVPKIEFGIHENENQFFMLGGDYFWGSFTFLPQISFSHWELDNQNKVVVYIPIRFEQGKNKFEFQILQTDSMGSFGGLEWTRSLDDVFSAAVFVQDYEGPNSEYLGLVNSGVNRGMMLGVRLIAIGGI